MELEPPPRPVWPAPEVVLEPAPELAPEVVVEPEEEPESAPVAELMVELGPVDVPLLAVLLVAVGGVAEPVVGTVSAGAPAVLLALVLLDPHPARTTPTDTAASAANTLSKTRRVT